ncbi:hypothetical protein LSAT2_009835 [Lamellibrachia satsuma]|nr:hypothetical protein LSAT2_009835 [Lamellibrachia satsuma]
MSRKADGAAKERRFTRSDREAFEQEAESLIVMPRGCRRDFIARGRVVDFRGADNAREEHMETTTERGRHGTFVISVSSNAWSLAPPVADIG